MNDERQELPGAPLHRGHDRRYLHEVGPRAHDVDNFNHRSSQIKYGLQSNNSGVALASDVAVQRVASVDDERSQGADALVIDLAVIRNDDDAVGRSKLFVS